MFHVYIIRSELDGSFYIGHTGNLSDRLLRHNQGRSQFTKAKRPWTLSHKESFPEKSYAVRRELQLKA